MISLKFTKKQLLQNSLLIGAVALILLSIVWFVWQNWFKPSVVTAEVTKGEVTLVRRFDKIKLDSSNSQNIFSGDVLQIDEGSELLLVFSNGQNVRLGGQKELVLSSSSKFGRDQLFVFQDQLSGKNFSYSIKFGLDKASAASVATSSNIQNVLGVIDQKPLDSAKYELFNKIHQCLNDKALKNGAEFEYSKDLKSCLAQYQLSSLEDLK